MKKISRKQWAAILLLGVLVVGGWWVRQLFFNGHSEHKIGATYYCPMHPTYTSDKPGDCPICNMKLVERTEEPSAVSHSKHPSAPDGYTSVQLTPQKQQRIGIKTASVQKRSLIKTIRTVGQIAYDPELYQAQQEYLQALHAFQDANQVGAVEAIQQSQRLIDAARTRLRLMGLGETLIEEMAGWQGPDERLLLADAQGQVWLYAPIYEFELSFVQIDQTMTAQMTSMPGKTLEGIIRSIDPVVDPATRSVRVRAVLTDPDKLLKPGMYANASIAIPTGELLAVPEEAIFDTGTRRIAFVDKGEGVFEPREVVVGVQTDGYYEVREGLAEGEMVVTSGNFLIDSESRLKAAVGAMGAGHQHGQ